MNRIHGAEDLAGTITRLKRYREAGADVFFAPGVTAPEDLRRRLAEVDRPVNVVARPGCPSVADLGALGVRRVSVGSRLAFAAPGARVEAATEFRDQGAFGYSDRARVGAARVQSSFATGLGSRVRSPEARR